MLKNKNYKILIGFIIGIIISVSGVYAATYSGAASDLSYNNQSSGLSSTNVQNALDELYNKSSTCPSGYICTPLKSTLAVGDYVSYTPSTLTYTTDSSKTGYSSSQIIYPYELDLWRVLKINGDGTVELISEYVSSTGVCFNGRDGIINIVGYLNVLASQYQTTGITVGSRHFGYNGQTEYLTDTSKLTYPAPWAFNTADNSHESQGGGDTLYLNDYNQLLSSTGTLVAYRKGWNSASPYYIASRSYTYGASYNFGWSTRTINAIGSLGGTGIYYYVSGFYYYNDCSAIRPIVILKSGLQFNGVGTKEAPMKIISS